MENNSNGVKTVDLPDLDVIPRGRWVKTIADLLNLPSGKALVVSKLSANDYQALNSAFRYRKNLGKKLHTRTIGEESYLWLSKADRK